MEPYTLILGSITRALAARRLLSASGISARTVKSGAEGGGCAYALQIDPRDLPTATQILEDGKIPFTWSRR
ncbi:MAG: DUF3343 domain-containing protein [Clostridia bacterium]|nr:DUF3343 domain-containing protein [Clostridia bacterium]